MAPSAKEGSVTADIQDEQQEQQITKIVSRYGALGKKPIVRLVRDTQCCVVKGSIFNFIHRLEGKWSGELQVLTSGGIGTSVNMIRSAPRAVSTKVTYRSEGYWLLRETTAGEDGAATINYLKMVPTGSGILSVELLPDVTNQEVEASLSAVPNLTFMEVANGAQLIQRQSAMGQLSLFELITIADEGGLIRTANTYAANGDLESIAISRQRSVS